MQRALFLFLFLVLSLSVFATETENLGIRVLPTPSKMVIDGKTNDWDLSGGVFVCGDVENLRDKIGCWIYTMYDQDNLYVLTKWVDETPMNNPGSVTGDMGFQGDCLQLRIVCNPEDTKNPAICWLTAWRDRDGKDVVNIDFYKYDGEKLRDAKTLPTLSPEQLSQSIGELFILDGTFNGGAKPSLTIGEVRYPVYVPDSKLLKGLRTIKKDSPIKWVGQLNFYKGHLEFAIESADWIKAR